MNIFKIHPLDLGRINRKIKENIDGEERIICKQLAVLAFYISDGKHGILVDTGGMDPEGPYGMLHQPYERTQEQTIDKQLARLGVDTHRIAAIILTHLHWDHASNNRLFPNATFFVQDSELRFALDAYYPHDGAYHHDLLFRNDYEAMRGDYEILDGVSVVHTPGHSPGHQSVVVRAEIGECVLIGDLVTTAECWHRVPKRLCRIWTSREDCRKSMEKVSAITDVIIPSHDPLVLEIKHPKKIPFTTPLSSQASPPPSANTDARSLSGQSAAMCIQQPRGIDDGIVDPTQPYGHKHLS